MKSYVLFIGCFILSALSNAGVRATLSDTTIGAGQSFRLVITNTSGTIKTNTVELQPLQQDFSIIGSEQQAQYSVVNGHASISSQWIITLIPKHTGSLTLPSLKIEHENTNPLTIEVKKETAETINSATSKQDDAILLLASVDKTQPYLNEQVVYTVKLLNSKQLIDAAFQAPTIKEGLLFPLGESKRYQTTKNQKIYNVEEQQYAIFPQKSGSVSILSPRFNALVFNHAPQQVAAVANPIGLHVQPAPPHQGRWFPAKDVQLSETFDTKLDKVAQGTSIVRTITVKARGTPAQLIPELHFSTQDKFSVYPEKRSEKNQLIDGELVAQNQIKLSYLIKESGPIRLPKVQLNWFNTSTKTAVTATLAPVAFTASASPQLPTKKAPIKVPETPAAVATPLKNNQVALPLVIIVPSLGLVLAGLIAFTVIQRRKKFKPSEQNFDMAAFKISCSKKDAVKIQQQLMLWAKKMWPDAPIVNTTAVKKLINDEQGSRLLEALNLALYSADKNPSWQPLQLWNYINNFRKPKTPTKSRGLPSINSNT